MTKARDNATQGGSVLLTTQNLSAVSSVSFTNILNNTYTHYQLLVSGNGSVNGANLCMRARINTTDVTSGYFCGSFYGAFNNVSGYPFSVNSGGFMVISDIGILNGYTEAVFSHTLKVTPDNRLLFGGSGVGGYYAGGVMIGGASAQQASPPTGFTIYTSSGTFTGTISLYGYRK